MRAPCPHPCDPSRLRLHHGDGGRVTVERPGLGSVAFLVPVTVTAADVASVSIERGSVAVHGRDGAASPPPGTRFNQPARVRLHGLQPRDPTTGTAITELRHPAVRRRIGTLRRTPGTVFEDYEPYSGTWTFTVQHFSRYTMPEDDDEDDDAEAEVQVENVHPGTDVASLQYLVRKTEERRSGMPLGSDNEAVGPVEDVQPEVGVRSERGLKQSISLMVPFQDSIVRRLTQRSGAVTSSSLKRRGHPENLDSVAKRARAMVAQEYPLLLQRRHRCSWGPAGKLFSIAG